MTGDEKSFTLTETRQLFENKELVREKKFEKVIPRKSH
jgi:hypothetical protein